MKITKSSLDGEPLLEIRGDIDHSTAEEFYGAVHSALNGGRTLFLDLTECRYADSGGLAVILATTRELGTDGRLGVLGANRNISRLFELVGLLGEPGFRTFPDREAAERDMAGDVR